MDTVKIRSIDFLKSQHNVSKLEKIKILDDIYQKYTYGHKLPIMAIIRNLRNFLKYDIDISHLNKIIDLMTDENVIKNSKLMPFRFLSAYLEIQEYKNNSKCNALINALEKALIVSANNLPFNTNDSILIASDVSGSMCSTISDKSKIQLYDIGLLLSMVYYNKCRYVEAGIFGDVFRICEFENKNILSNVSKLKSIANSVGWSTNAYRVLRYALENNKNFDRILIFTDCQFKEHEYVEIWKKYKEINNNAKLYLFNLNGYGKIPLQLNDSDVYLISGFNEQIFNSFDIIDNKTKILNEIQKIEL